MTVEYNRDRWPEEFTEMSIEKVSTFQDRDDAFFTELRIITGPQKGQLKRTLWFKHKRDGNPRKDTHKLLTALLGSFDVPAFKLTNKIFKAKPWYPDDAEYPIFTQIEKIGEVEDAW